MEASSSKNTLFSLEQKVVERAEAALAKAESKDAPLRREFERLLEQYKKIFKQSERLIRLSDSQQQKLNDALEQLENAKEMADSANRFKSMFLANMSHEIRTPMNAIIGLTSLALKAEVSPKVREYLNTVQISAHSLLGIINDILDFSKIEAGKLDLESVAFHLESVMGYISDLFSERAANTGVELLFHIDEDVPRQLVGDPLRLGQILVNLTGNAMKFTAARQDRDFRESFGNRFETDHDSIPDFRHGHRHRRGPAAPSFRLLHAGRRLHHEKLRRHGTGADHLQAARGNDGWRHEGAEQDWRGQHILLRVALSFGHFKRRRIRTQKQGRLQKGSRAQGFPPDRPDCGCCS